MKTGEKKLLILGGGQMQVPIIQRANKIGLYTIVADMDENAPGLAIASERLLKSTMDFEAIEYYVEHHPIDGILTTSDAPVNVVAAIGAKFHLPAMPIEAARICTNKYLQRECFRKHGINTPKFCIVTNGKYGDEIKEMTYPLIVKPIDSSASRGVTLVENANELKDAILMANNLSPTKKVIIETFIEGREFSVESYTQHGETHIISITQKHTIGEEYGCFVEDTHIEPAQISGEETLLIQNEVLLALKAIGVDNCPNHTEIKINSTGACIVETACRLGGGYITSDLVPLSTGVDMLENLIKVSFGEEIDIEKKYNKCSAIQFMNTKNYWRCIDFISSNHNAIRRYAYQPYCDKPIRSGLDRLGYVILQTETMAEMQEILKTIK